ncbi:MAG TPA: hypothetical protein VFP10_08030 [Candidatus Eisenbacteria bacterium]|nr:hypothetical protein [Candidatus Eisenbacteria bacterium]
MSQPYKHEEILWIEMSMREIQDDALGRYIHDPANRDRILDLFRDTLRHLKEIVTEPQLRCPPGYTHKNCACTADIHQRRV